VGWWEDLQASVGPAATLTSLAVKFAGAFQGPKPELRLELRGVAQDDGRLEFGAWVSEVGNQVPALGVHLFAEIEGEGVVFEAPRFKLSAGELDRYVGVVVRRPEHGTLVPACNNEPTLYGRELTVTVVSEKGGIDVVTWRETTYEPGSARYEAMQRVWEAR
jgi:hypothetical protein